MHFEFRTSWRAIDKSDGESHNLTLIGSPVCSPAVSFIGRPEKVTKPSMTTSQLSTREFIRRSQTVHGKNYDYSRVEYRGINYTVKIRCPKHGWFKQQARSHMKGRGCQRCGHDKTVATLRRANVKKRETCKRDFVSKARRVHGDYYDYSKVDYVGSGEVVEIICPIHGLFSQRPINHTRGHGCVECGHNKLRESKTRKHTKAQIKRLVDDAVKSLGGRFPTHTDCVEKGWFELDGVIVRKLGGYRAARLQFGFAEVEKAKGFWRDWDNVEAYLKKHFPKLIASGQCPTFEMMQATGEYPSFVHCSGGMPGICKHFGLVPAVGFEARDGHILRSFFELLLDEYLHSRNIDHLPEAKPFARHRFRCDQKVGDFFIEVWGITNSAAYDKKRKRKERLYRRHGLKLISLEQELFRPSSIKKIETELNTVFAGLGFDVRKTRPYTMRAIARSVNYPWTEDSVRNHIQKFVQKYGEFPTRTKLRDYGVNGLSNRILQFGGFPYFRKLMNHQPWQPKKKWTDAMIIERLDAICNRLGRFPKDNELPGALKNAIRKNSAGGLRDLNYYRKHFGYEITRKSKGYWTEETIRVEIQNVIETNGGDFPSNTTLREMSRCDLSVAIQSHGGFRYWRKRIGA